MNIFIGGAWPYANGSLHLGHISSLLPGDILARYFRQHGDNVLYVSGSDCNGTPISIRAKQEGISPKEVADRYHEEFTDCFKRLGFSYDCYSRTDTPKHHQVVQEIFLKLLENGYIYRKDVEQTYCEPCEQFLPDRYVEGNCPHCGKPARGDQCDYCSAILDPIDLVDKSCKLCGNRPSLKTTEHFYLALSKLQSKLENYTEDAKNNKSWRTNAIHLTDRYLNEGLLDRAASRDLPIGVSIPVKGYEDKKIYVWIEAVSGYYSASKQWETNTNQPFEQFWNDGTKTYYVHGKDNIPFHTIIWPAVLMGIGNRSLPQHIVSNEYLTLEKKKLSTSKNWAVWVPDMVNKYHPDSIRYFLTVNAPENRDTDFSWREFIYSHNSELLGAYGNFINRTLKFIEKNYEGKVPEGSIDQQIKIRIDDLYSTVGSSIENAKFKEPLEEIFAFVRNANKYFDEKQPWRQWKDNKTECSNTLLTCVYIIANLAQLLAPFLPFSSNEVKHILNIHDFSWQPIQTKEIKLSPSKPIFARIDVSSIDLELKQLFQRAK